MYLMMFNFLKEGRNMKTQKTLILVGLAMSLTMATGCKNSSKSAPEEALMGNPGVTSAVDAEASAFQTAGMLKARANAALEGLGESKNALSEAKKYRDDLIQARNVEGNSIIRDILSSQVEGSIKEVQALEKNVEIATNLLIAERKILNEALKNLSAEDQALLGESDAEFQMEFNDLFGLDQKMDIDEKKARIEMSLDAARELTRTSEAKVQELNERLKISEEQIAKLESARGAIPDQVLESEKRNFENLLKDISDAEQTLAVNIASEDNLVKLYNDMSI